MPRQIVVGDIHGCHRELVELCDKLAVIDDDMLISVGDLVDRGPEPAEVVQLFRERRNSVVLTGNHERKHVRGVFSYAQEITKLQLGAAYAEIVQWMAALPYYLELPDAIIVHAALEPGVPLAAQKQEVLCGSTAGESELETKLGAGRWWHEHYDGARPVIFGHHVVEQPLVRPGKIYGIDTGACFGGALTAVVLPGFDLVSVPAREDHWARAKRTWQADVLTTRPWADMSWAELDEQLARFGKLDEPRTHAYVEALRAWRGALAARTTAAFEAVHREAQRIAADEATRNDVAKRHPLAALLFQAFRGRLDRAAFDKQCQTPRKLATVGAPLGLPPLEPPAAPVRAG
ncbi:MAG: serine/threonine protein phosphatase [Deltaproteobacteria bacterium]|nr:MAG: serine/threonine protein phosphatase [Deltaproteobacteria bacterium]TMQ28583.1 MAG: serine/threonine protein phosphatase [Deltaproteobacteria bacterium]